MAERRDILWRFLGDAKGLDQASKAATKDLKGVSKGMAGVQKAAIGVGAALAGREVLQFAGDAVQAAIAADEAASKFDAVFGSTEGAADAMEDYAEKTGTATAKSQDLFGTLGNLLQTQGLANDAALDLTEQVGSLAGDLASFNDSNPEEVFNDLAFAITTTERDALKKYGITISETEVKTKALEVATKAGREEVTKADRAVASYRLALEQSGKAIGDLDRTSDSLANRQRRLNAAIEDAKVAFGKELLPVMEDLLPLLEDAIPLVTKLGSVFGRAVDNVTAFTGALSSQEEEYKNTGSALDRVTDLLGGFSGMLSRAPFLITPVQERLGRLQTTLHEVGESINTNVEEWDRYIPVVNEVEAALRGQEDAAEATIPWINSLQAAYHNAGLTAEQAGIRIANMLPPSERVARAVERIQTRDLPSAIRQAEGFQSGGIVPGPKGQPRLITAHGGERVSGMGDTGGGGGVVINFNGVVGDPDAVAAQIADLFTRYQQTNVIPIDGLSSF